MLETSVVGRGSHQPVVQVLVDPYTPLKCHELTSLATTVNSMGAVDRPKGRALNW